MSRRAWVGCVLGVLLGLGGFLPLAGASDEPPFERRQWLVLGPDGKPLEAVRVARATEQLPRGWIFDATRPGAEATTPGGVLQLPGATAVGDSPLVVWQVGLAALEAPRGRQAIGVRLARAERLAGLLRFARGEPAGDLAVLAFPARAAGLVHRVRTSEEGRFAFERLGAGDWEVAVVRGDGRVQSLGVFAAGREARVDVLGRGCTVTGRLLDDGASRPTGLEGLALRLVALPRGSIAGGPPTEVVSDADGRFDVPDVPSGVYEAELLAPGRFFATGAPRLEVPLRGRLRLPPFFVQQGRRVTGRIEAGRREPVAGARVRPVPDPTSAPPPGGWPDLAPVSTGTDGTFAFEGVRPGLRYGLAVRAEGFSPARSEIFEVAPRKPTQVPTIRLRPGWRMEVRARVPGGAPLAGVRVLASPAGRPAAKDLEAPNDEWTASAVTDGGGRAVLIDLPEDDLRVRAFAEGRLEATGWIPELRTGDTRIWNVTLFEAPGLRGTVVLPPEGGPRDLTVRLVPLGRALSRTARLGPDLRFAFAALPAVPTDVEVCSVEGPVLARVGGVIPGTVDFLSIQLPAMLAIRGRVEQVPAGVKGIDVVLEAPVFDPIRGEHRWRVVQSSRSLPEDGRAFFAFEPLPPGVYSVRARDGQNDSGPVDVTLDEESQEGVVLLLPAPGRVAGTVLDRESLPVLGAEVTLTRLRGDGEPPGLPGGPIRRTTDRRGAYVFEDVAPGLWRVAVRDDDVAPDEAVVRVAEGESLVIRDLVLGAGGTLTGRVTDSRDRALDDALLILSPIQEDLEDRRARTRDDGVYRLDRLRPGIWRLRLAAEAGPFQDLETLVEVVDGETTEIDLRAGGQARIEGRVERRGRAVADAVVHLVRRGNWEDEHLGQRLVARTDAEGKFGWDGLEAGRYEIDLVDGGVHLRRAIQLQETDVLFVDLEAHDGRIPGEVRRLSGVGVAGATVWARPQGEEAPDIVALVQTDPEGRFLFTGLWRGLYDLRVAGTGLPPGRAFGVVAEAFGAERFVSIPLGMGGTLEVAVGGRGGRGVGATRLWIEAKDTAPLNIRPYVTPPTGRIVVEGVPEGEWWLRVHAVGYGRPARIPLRIREAEATVSEVKLEAAGRLEVRVTGAWRDPVTRARLDVLRLPDRDPIEVRRPLARVRLEAPWGHLPRTGAAAFEDLATGAYLVRVDAGPYYEVAEVEVDVAAGETTERGIQLVRAGR